MKRLPPWAFWFTKEEREIEDAVERGEYVPVSPEKEKEILRALENWRQKVKQKEKDAILHMRINRQVLNGLKKKAKKMKIKYQTFIAEILTQIVQA